METALQVVAFNIPYPPDYGGVIDIYYKVKALSKCGVKIHLHCFEYDRQQAEELEEYCAKVFYYKRKAGVRYQFSSKPYITITRENDQLLSNLSSVNYPILFEGLHTCFYLDHPALKNHIRLVRTHNIEHEYYKNLQLAEHHFFKKIYFGMEAKKLARYEQVLKYASELLCISPNDNFYFDHHFGHSHFIPAFHPFSEIKSKPGKGRYVLFHGNLSVAENFQAAEFLVTQVLGQTRHEVIIAGKNPPDRLIRKIGLHSNIQLVANPDNEQMENLIRQAHICLLPTFQDTGLKLKLLASLFSGRFCIANTPMVHKTGLEHLCHIADTPEEMIRLIDELFIHDFPAEEIEKRRLILEDTFSNHQNALKIIRLIEEKK
ncbi:MAG: glycosyltransferase family 4 protein [Prolixibacteraceae bacterium]|nr:glycosyltransferase family 4 protein [Prolixibacteraceae bacterium]